MFKIFSLDYLTVKQSILGIISNILECSWDSASTSFGNSISKFSYCPRLRNTNFQFHIKSGEQAGHFNGPRLPDSWGCMILPIVYRPKKCGATISSWKTTPQIK